MSDETTNTNRGTTPQAAAPTAATPQPSAIDRLAGIVGTLAESVAKMATAQVQPATVAPVATAPSVAAPVPASAPTQPPVAGVTPISEGGLPNVFAYTEAQVRALGPRGVRKFLDDCRQHDNERSGLARIPAIPNPHSNTNRKSPR